MIERPKCTRCHGPLDFFPDPETGHYEWCCNNLAGKSTPMYNDEEFQRRWENLPGDDVVRLEKSK
jgi:hypothetical protein